MEVLRKRGKYFLLTFFFFSSLFLLPGCSENISGIIINWLGSSGVEQPYDTAPEENTETPPEESILNDLKPVNATVSNDTNTTSSTNFNEDLALLNLSFNNSATAEGQQYWVNESNLILDLKARQSAEWSVEVLQAKTLGTIDPPPQPAEGAKVTVELKDPNNTETLTGTVGADGWVRWNTAFPKVNTYMYLIDIEGNLPWAAEDQAFWDGKSILSYTGAETQQ